MNPAGRDGESLKLWESAKPKLEEAGFQTEVHLTERVGHASEISFSLKDREDIDLVVANGGDGTVHEVASGLRGSNIPLAIIPAGTGNDVARVHGYSLDDLDKCISNCNIELKIDTGMGRNGILPSEILNALSIIKKKNLKLNGVFTHFSSADENDDITFAQEKLFLDSVSIIKSTVDIAFRIHCANSAGAHKVNNDLYDMARVGIGLYGYLDISEVKDLVEPVLSLHAKKISTRFLNIGDTINYGATFIVPYDNFVVSNYDVGYSDGFFRLNERKKAVTVKNKEILGRVSMDSLSVEGDDKEICIFNNARELAKVHDTIHYEILTNLHASVPKFII